MIILARLIAAILLLPVVWGSLIGLFDMISFASASATKSVISLTTGACLMWVLLALSRPHRLYVLAHELTHAVSALLTGRRVHGVRIGKRSGSTTVSNANTFIRLAPYLFPFYTLVLATAFAIASLFASPERLLWLWLAGFGATWAFHVAFTVDALTRPQSDLRRSGWLLSMVLILWVNILVVALGLCLATPATLRHYAHSTYRNTARAVSLVIPRR